MNTKLYNLLLISIFLCSRADAVKKHKSLQANFNPEIFKALQRVVKPTRNGESFVVISPGAKPFKRQVIVSPDGRSFVISPMSSVCDSDDRSSELPSTVSASSPKGFSEDSGSSLSSAYAGIYDSKFLQAADKARVDQEGLKAFVRALRRQAGYEISLADAIARQKAQRAAGNLAFEKQAKTSRIAAREARQEEERIESDQASVVKQIQTHALQLGAAQRVIDARNEALRAEMAEAQNAVLGNQSPLF